MSNAMNGVDQAKVDFSSESPVSQRTDCACAEVIMAHVVVQHVHA
jgi:hypothetical protein